MKRTEHEDKIKGNLLFVMFSVLLFSAAVFTSSAQAAAKLKLPAPIRYGGPNIFSVIENRSSAPSRDFPKGKISDYDLSTILWAATGLNRGDGSKGWTVPFAMGSEPYVRVYVLRDDGVFLYNWKDVELSEISDKNIKDTVSPQKTVADADVLLVFVGQGDKLSTRPYSPELGYVAVGAMTQNAYLASEALGVGVRYIAAMNSNAIRRGLSLKNSDSPLAIMMLGKKRGQPERQ